jgi:cytochrome c oxidase subunit 2
MHCSTPYYCIASAFELWFERLDFDPFYDLAGSSGWPFIGIRAVQQSCVGAGMLLSSRTRSGRGMTTSKGQMGRRLLGLGVAGAGLMSGGSAFAELGQPAPWEYKLQEAASPVMESITSFHNFLLWMITIITLFVLVLLVIVVVKFNAKANPVPSRTTHNTLIEVVWTIVPVMILAGIVIPSFKLLFEELDVPKADLTIKATGKQWYWSYAYPDNGKFEFDSLMAADKQPRLLGVDNEMVVPVNKVIRVQTTGADVIHSFAVPAFGIKIDAIPGRLNETWFKATKVGMFYGQCSELCGKDHAFMPIAVRVVSDQEFAQWVEGAKKKFASGPSNSFASIGTAAQ